MGGRCSELKSLRICSCTRMLLDCSLFLAFDSEEECDNRPASDPKHSNAPKQTFQPAAVTKSILPINPSTSFLNEQGSLT